MEYPEVRMALRAQAGQWIDQHRERLAAAAFEEMHRLDILFGYRASADGVE
jgi:hypothetical protein